MQWFVARNGQSVGPMEDAELQRQARAGELKPADLVWHPDLGAAWVPASSIPGLFDASAANPTAVAAPAVTTYAPPPAATPGQTHNRDLMGRARDSLNGQWGLGIAATAIFMAISVGSSSLPFGVGSIASLIISGPLTAGVCLFFLHLARRTNPAIETLFKGFHAFGTMLAAYLLVALFTFLWLLLLVIPGIIAALSYAMTFFILAEHPETGAREAIRQSKEMMNGYKWKYFCLNCRFIGWGLLAMLTCGIGFLWLVPYIQTSISHFYDDIRTR